MTIIDNDINIELYPICRQAEILGDLLVFVRDVQVASEEDVRSRSSVKLHSSTCQDIRLGTSAWSSTRPTAVSRVLSLDKMIKYDK